MDRGFFNYYFFTSQGCEGCVGIKAAVGDDKIIYPFSCVMEYFIFP